MFKQYGIAVIGAGSRGGIYSNVFKQIIRQTAGAKLVVMCDIDNERAVKCQEEFGYEHICADYKEAASRADVDVVVVCTPAYFHPEMSIFAMQHGKHVICEKPMALSLKDADEMVEAADKYGVKLAMAFQYRNGVAERKIKIALEKDLIGRPMMMRYTDIRSIRPKPAMHDAEFGNGGPMVDMSCHFIDLFRLHFNSEPVRVYARSLTFAGDRPEIDKIKTKAPDTAVLLIDFESGDVGIINVCWGLPPKVDGYPMIDIWGPKGLIHKSGITGGKVECKFEGGEIQELELSLEDTVDNKGPEVALAYEFLKAIEGRGEVQVDGRNGYIALATSMAALKSASLGRPVTLTEIFEDKPNVLECMRKSEVK